MTMIADDSVQISKAALLELGRRASDEGPDAIVSDPTTATLIAPALVLATAKAHLVATAVRAGEIRRVDVWLSEVGAVALANQESDDVAGPAIWLPPHSALEVCTSSLGLDPSAIAHAGSIPAPSGLGGLVEEVLGGGTAAAGATLNVLDWTMGDDTERWVVLDSPQGRVACLDAPTPMGAEFLMVATSPMSLAGSLSSVVAAAIAPMGDGDDTA